MRKRIVNSINPKAVSSHQISKFIFTLILLLFDTSILSSQFNYLTVKDGLKSSIVRAVIKSKNDVVWIGTLKGLYTFDGYQTTQVLKPDGLPFNSVRSIKEGNDGTIWIGTKNDGIFFIKSGSVNKFNALGHLDPSTFQVMLISNDSVYLIFKHSIVQINELKISNEFENPLDEVIYSAIVYAEGQLMIGLQTHVYLINLFTNELRSVVIQTDEVNRRKHVLHKDDEENIWLGRSDGLYLFDTACQCFLDRHDVLDGTEVHSLGSGGDEVWIGTNQMGAYSFNHKENVITHFNYDKTNQNSINDSAVISIHVSQDGDLFLGTFNGGMNFLNLDSLAFGSLPGASSLASCLPSQVVYGMYELSEFEVLVGTNKGFTHLDLLHKTCEHYSNDSENNFSVSGRYVFSFHHRGDELLLMGSAGIDSMDLSTNEIKVWSDLIPKVPTFFLFKMPEEQYIFGTDQGLYSFYPATQSLKLLESTTNQMLPFRFYHAVKTPMGVYFSSTNGLYKYVRGALEHVPVQLDDGTYVKDITGLSFDGNDGLLIAADKKFFIHFKPGKATENLSHLVNESDFNVTLFEVIKDDNDLYWISSDYGLFQLDLKGKNIHRFQDTDGLQSNDFLLISSHQGKSGKLYFGGRQGFNAFYPEDIRINETPPKVVLTEVSQLSKTVKLGERTLGGFVLDQPINQMEKIELGYKDLAIGFEFAALDYADSSRNQYAYRLLGFNEEWSYVGAGDRKANYTNLKPGDYTFQVKASNKDGVWTPEPKELSIKVYPAPWFSPWAYAAYVLIILASIWGFIRYKTIASRKRAEELEVTVTERTQEVVQQKRMVESLLDHKNEVFANVTHEFKTPLALILGPVDEMADEPELGRFKSQIDMVQRNAKRLLLMVGQILKLSQAEQDKEVIREPQAVQPILLMLHESFSPLANDKDIVLSLDNEHDVNIYATAECLETVVGNLISNAIKYTQSGGSISIASSVQNEQVTVEVRDDGPGIKEEDLDRIFKRFTRLDDHKTVQGTGIGLSVVKEVSEANSGHVKVTSKVGQGSVFSVTFPITHMSVDGELSRVMTDQLVSNVTTEMVGAGASVLAEEQLHKVTVLIIEDNLDMQQHTANVLKGQFNCLFADRGELGIALALKEVPDIIICDVMMPGMDGYQVTRILRHDERTSHIPIILLTALNTKESRIKGWREKIDRYMTKPFDGTELIVQLESILSIRQLLQKKTNQVIADHGSLSTLDLPKQDLKFIEKLQDVIAQYYSNEYFQKADLANKMAISERQLQRKVKAMMGVGPLDMLRDYRLEQSKLKLKEGYQVGQVSDDCGFGSVSYFGTCFKKKYGMTPKQYQQLD